MSQEIILSTHPLNNRILLLEFNRPAHKNGLTLTFAQQFSQALSKVANNQQCSVLLIRGRGDCFMAGADLHYLHQQLETATDKTQALDPQILVYINRAILTMQQLNCIIVCQITGMVAGVGIGMMLAADLNICSDKTVFNLAYSNIGTTLDGGASWFLPRIVGRQKALELALLSPSISAPTAQQLNLVNFVCDAAQLENQCQQLLTQLLGKSQQSLQKIKKLMQKSWHNDLASQLQLEAKTFLQASSNPDFAEGVAAFLQRRSPDFQF